MPRRQRLLGERISQVFELGRYVRSYRSSRVMTVGPLFSRMASSEWMPTRSSFPNCRACNMAPACPIFGINGFNRKDMGKVQLTYHGEKSPSIHQPRSYRRGFLVLVLQAGSHPPEVSQTYSADGRRMVDLVGPEEGDAAASRINWSDIRGGSERYLTSQSLLHKSEDFRF